VFLQEHSAGVVELVGMFRLRRDFRRGCAQHDRSPLVVGRRQIKINFRSRINFKIKILTSAKSGQKWSIRFRSGAA
jgi:hypothetical protein